MTHMRPCTPEEKAAILATISRGYTRGRFHTTPVEELPFYIMEEEDDAQLYCHELPPTHPGT